MRSGSRYSFIQEAFSGKTPAAESWKRSWKLPELLPSCALPGCMEHPGCPTRTHAKGGSSEGGGGPAIGRNLRREGAEEGAEEPTLPPAIGRSFTAVDGGRRRGRSRPRQPRPAALASRPGKHPPLAPRPPARDRRCSPRDEEGEEEEGVDGRCPEPALAMDMELVPRAAAVHAPGEERWTRGLRRVRPHVARTSAPSAAPPCMPSGDLGRAEEEETRPPEWEEEARPAARRRGSRPVRGPPTMEFGRRKGRGSRAARRVSGAAPVQQ